LSIVGLQGKQELRGRTSPGNSSTHAVEGGVIVQLARRERKVCDGRRQQWIERHGPFTIDGDRDIMRALDALLNAFVEQRRMKIAGTYKPCYRVLGG
jgi:hypothetical protein